MRKSILLIAAILLLALAVVPVAAQGTLLDTAAESADLTTLVTAVQAADESVAVALDGPGPLTVFAPNNAAFSKFGTYLEDNFGITLEDLLQDEAALTALLNYHVVPGNVFSEFLSQSDGGLLPTVQGGSIGIVIKEDGTVSLNNGVADVVAPDIVTSNGVVHIIEDVIFNSEIEALFEGVADRIALGTSIAGVAANNDDFSILFAAVEAAGLTEVLNTGFPFTVFAPTNAAFEAVLEARGLTAEELLADTELLDTILRYHIVSDEVTSEELAELESVASILDENLPGDGETISVAVGEDGSITLNGSATVVNADVEADNGVIHAIDAVLVPQAAQDAFARVDFDAAVDPESISGIALNNEDFSILYEALYASGFAEVLNTGFPFTVFAPTNAAFEALLEELGMSAEELLADTELLDTVLRYHVVSDEVTAEEVVAADGGSIASILNEVLPGDGEPINVAVVDGVVVLNGSANVIDTDIAAQNGIVHVIDAVLLPPMGDMDDMGDMGDMGEEDGEEMAEGGEEMAALPTVGEIIRDSSDHVTLYRIATGLGDDITSVLNCDAPITVFAPTDAAFDAAFEALGVDLSTLLMDTELASMILTYHVLDGAVLAEDVVGLDGQSVVTVQGSEISISIVDDVVVLNDTVNVTMTDLMASNGVVHVVDAVLVPPQE